MRTTLVPIEKRRHRLLINGGMRDRAGVDVGDRIEVALHIDLQPRDVPMPKGLADALQGSRSAKEAWEQLTPSRQKEILRYLNFTKHQATLQRNIKKVLGILTGKKSPKKRLAGVRL